MNFSRMNKFTLTLSIVLFLVVFMCTFLFVGCGDCVVTFDSNGGTSVNSVTIPGGSTFEEAKKEWQVPTKQGYVFVNWYTSADFTAGTEFTQTTKVSRNTKVYARWRPTSESKTDDEESFVPDVATFTINLDPNVSGGGWEVTPTQIIVDQNTSVSQTGRTLSGVIQRSLPDPIKEDYYTFDGWFDASDSQYTSGRTIYGNVNLIARYTYVTPQPSTCIISLNATSRTGGISVTPNTIVVNQNSTIAATGKKTDGTSQNVLPTPSMHDNYRFDGWFDDVYSGNEYLKSTTIPQVSVLTLYAHYTYIEPAKEYCYVSLNSTANTGGSAVTPSTIVVEKGTTIAATGKTTSGVSQTTLPTPEVYDNYTFIGWFNTQTGSNLYDENTRIDNSITLYARYNYTEPTQQTETFTVTLNVNGGVYVSPNTIYVTEGSTIAATGKRSNGLSQTTLPTPTAKTNYMFLGWYDSLSGGTKYTASSTISSNITLYAHWDEILTYVMQPNNETCFIKGLTDNGKTLSSITIPAELGGYTVTKINSQAFINCTFSSVTIPASVEIIGESAFKNCGSLSTVTIGDNSQLNRIDTLAFANCSSLTSFTIPAGVEYLGKDLFYSSLTNLTFRNTSNWSYVDNGTTVSVASNDISNSSSAATFFKPKNAISAWQKVKYTVTFNKNCTDNTVTLDDATIAVAPNSTINPLPGAHRNGFFLDGWYTDTACTSEFTISSTVNNNITLYAKWTEISDTYVALVAEFAINKMKEDAYKLSFQVSGGYSQYAFKKIYFTNVSYKTQNNKYMGTATIDLATKFFSNGKSFIDLYKESSDGDHSYAVYKNRLTNNDVYPERGEIFDKSIEALKTVTIVDDSNIVGYYIDNGIIYMNSTLSSKPRINNIQSCVDDSVIKVNSLSDTTGYENIRNALNDYYFFFKPSGGISSQGIENAPMNHANNDTLQFTND